MTEISILMATFWSTIFIVFAYLIRKRKALSPVFSISCFIIIYIFSTIRMIFSIDFIPSKGIVMEGFFSEIYEKICLDTFLVGTKYIKIFEVIIGVWMIGSFIQTIRCVYNYKKVVRVVLQCEKWDDERENMEKIYKSTGKKIPVGIRVSENIGTPMVIGVWKKIILLPKREYSCKELYYILLHEYTHILNKDLILKWFIQICGIIFWWNPIVRILKNEVSQTLEIKCDLSVTGRLTSEETMEYLQTIVDVLKHSLKQKKMDNYRLYEMAPLIQNPQKEVTERFNIVVNASKKKKTYMSQIYMGIFLFLFLLSYSFVPQPSYESEIEQELLEEESKEEDVYILTPGNSYIVKDKNGKYHWIRENVMDDIISEQEKEQLRKEGFPERK